MGHLSFPLLRPNRALLFHPVHPHKSTARFGRRERGERGEKATSFFPLFLFWWYPSPPFAPSVPEKRENALGEKILFLPFDSLYHTHNGREEKRGRVKGRVEKEREGWGPPLASLIYGENGRETGLWWNMGRRPSLGAKGRGKAVSAGRIAL